MKLDVTNPQVSSKWERLAKQVGRQLLLQFILLVITVIVIFPVVWIVAISLDSRGLPQYSELVLFPESITFSAFEKLLFEPFQSFSNTSFTQLLSNSLFVALGTAMLSVGLGASAAYAFSRFKFIGRQAGMLGFILLLMMPATGTLVPLIALFSLLKVHVFFSTFAPSIFYGCLIALVVFGINRGVQRAIDRDVVKDTPFRWLGLVGVVILVFGLQFLGWMMLFRNSEAYDVNIREPLTETNELREEVQSVLNDIPKVEENVIRQERRLESARAERDDGLAFQNRVNDALPGAYDLVEQLSGFGFNVVNTASLQSPALDETAQHVFDPRFIDLQYFNAEIADQEEAVSEAIAAVPQREADLVEARRRYHEAREPYIQSRNDVIGNIAPHVLLSTLASILIAGFLWVNIIFW